MSWFRRSPKTYEARGDACAKKNDWVQAKHEYESALDQLEKDSFVPSYRIDQLHTKVREVIDSLVHEHQQNAKNLIERGFYDDALELLELILTLTEDKTITSETRQLTQKLKEQNMFSADEEDNSSQSDDEIHFSVLIESLHESMHDAYLSYGESFRRGYLALNRGDFEIAARELTQAMQNNPQEGFILVELASALVNLERFKEAQPLLERFIALQQNYFPAYRMLCEIYWEEKHYELAETLLSNLPQELSDSMDIHILIAQSKYQSGELSESKELYLEILNRFGWDNGMAIELANVYEAAEEPYLASQIYRKIMSDYNNRRKPIPIKIQRKFATLSFAAGEREPSLLQLKLSLAIDDPENVAEYYQNISQIYSSWQDDEAAQKYRVMSKKQHETILNT